MYVRTKSKNASASSQNENPALRPNWSEKSLSFRDTYNSNPNLDCCELPKKPSHTGFSLDESGITEYAAQDAARNRLESGLADRNDLFSANVDTMTGIEYRIQMEISKILRAEAKTRVDSFAGNMLKALNDLSAKSENRSIEELLVTKEVLLLIGRNVADAEKGLFIQIKNAAQQEEAMILAKNLEASKEPLELHSGFFNEKHAGIAKTDKIDAINRKQYDDEVQEKTLALLNEKGISHVFSAEEKARGR